MSKSQSAADLHVVEPTRAGRAVECLPSAVGDISALASANAPILFFDEISFCSVNQGIGGVTLTAARQIANVPGEGVVSDRVIVAHLRASLTTLLALRATIDEVERMAKRQVEAAAAATNTPTSLPH